MSINLDKRLKTFRRLGVISIIAVYLLIFVGGVVRSSGSGMGCPDWPKCFGQWVPPTDQSELSVDYKEVYADKRKAKNEKLANMLSTIGANSLALDIRGDQNTYIEEDFNAQKTWVEYINRLIGAIIGILLFALFVSSLPLYTANKSLVLFSGFILVLTGFQGWLGSIVVSTNLLPGMITIHMLIALLIISSLIILVYGAYKDKSDLSSLNGNKSLGNILLIMLIALIPQIVLGTEVRSQIDNIARTLGDLNRSLWIENLDWSFYIHRSFSWVFLGFSGFLFYKIRTLASKDSIEYKLSLALLGLIGLEIVFGILMYAFEIPAFIQPLHLLVGTLLFGLVQLLYLMSKPKQAA